MVGSSVNGVSVSQLTDGGTVFFIVVDITDGNIGGVKWVGERQPSAMCEIVPNCDGVMNYDTCMECGARIGEQCSMRTNIHLPSEQSVRRQKEKLARRS